MGVSTPVRYDSTALWIIVVLRHLKGFVLLVPYPSRTGHRSLLSLTRSQDPGLNLDTSLDPRWSLRRGFMYPITPSGDQREEGKKMRKEQGRWPGFLTCGCPFPRVHFGVSSDWRVLNVVPSILTFYKSLRFIPPDLRLHEEFQPTESIKWLNEKEGFRGSDLHKTYRRSRIKEKWVVWKHI